MSDTGFYWYAFKIDQPHWVYNWLGDADEFENGDDGFEMQSKEDRRVFYMSCPQAHAFKRYLAVAYGTPITAVRVKAPSPCSKCGK